MGFILTLAYIALALLSPQDLMPFLAEYRVELLVMLAALVVSTPRLLAGNVFRIPQSYLLGGLFAAVFLSIAIGDHWPGGGFLALQKFLVVGLVFYLVVLNCKSIRRLKAIVSLITLIAAFYVVQGARAYYAADTIKGCRTINNEQKQLELAETRDLLPPCNPLLEALPLSDGTFAYRVRGLGFFKDPNELAQFLVMVLPLLWIRWRKDQRLQNLFLVIAPSALLIWGMYLTHSRGGLIALVVVLMLALKDRVSLVKTILAGVLAFAVMMALNFSGGRDISVQSGSNRFILWGDGLALFKSSPAFGVGYENFATANHGQTAHNSFIVCLAELGLLGYAFWVALLVFTIAGLNSLLASLGPGLNKSPPSSGTAEGPEESDLVNAEYHRWAMALRLSIAGYLASGFFLSRAYALIFYMVVGMAVVILSLASTKEESVDEQPLWRKLSLSAAVGVAAIAMVYITLRIGNALAMGSGGNF